jgi:hypothetical protein
MTLMLTVTTRLPLRRTDLHYVFIFLALALCDEELFDMAIHGIDALLKGGD